MFLQYDLDITKDSVWIINTPIPLALRLPFYMNECGCFLAKGNYYTIREGKDDYIMVFCLSGKGGVEYKGRTYELVPNTCILVDCRKRSNFYSMEDSWNFYFLHFMGDGVKGFAEILEGKEFVTILNPELYQKEMQQIFASSKVNDIAANLTISASIHSLLSEIVRSGATYQGHISDSEYRLEIQLVLRFISEHYADKITLEDMLSVVHMSKYHFVRVFKKYIGTSPYQYLQTIRISRAKMLLREGNLPNSEVGAQVGFADTNNFIRTFKQMVGSTPFQYRKKYGLSGHWPSYHHDKHK